MTFASFSMERRLRERRRTRPGPYSKISESRPDATRGPAACSMASLYLILANLSDPQAACLGSVARGRWTVALDSIVHPEAFFQVRRRSHGAASHADRCHAGSRRHRIRPLPDGRLSLED